MAGGSNILHCTGTRVRVVGVGELDMQLLGLDDILTETLHPFTMQLTNFREMNRIANFQGQYTRIKVSTDVINEVFKINSIVLFMKPLWSDYPGTD